MKRCEMMISCENSSACNHAEMNHAIELDDIVENTILIRIFPIFSRQISKRRTDRVLVRWRATTALVLLGIEAIPLFIVPLIMGWHLVSAKTTAWWESHAVVCAPSGSVCYCYCMFPNPPRLIYSVCFSSISSVRQDRKVTVQYKIWRSHTKFNLRVVRRNVFSTDWFGADRSFDLEDSQQISP